MFLLGWLLVGTALVFAGGHTFEATGDARSAARAKDLPPQALRLTTQRDRALGRIERVDVELDGILTDQPWAVERYDAQGQRRYSVVGPTTFADQHQPSMADDQLVLRISRNWGLTDLSLGPVKWSTNGFSHWRKVRRVVVGHPWRGLHAPVLVVDAVRGTILYVEDDATNFAGPPDENATAAAAYLLDPLLNDAPTKVELPDRSARDLIGPHLRVHQCIDRGGTYTTNSSLGEVQLRLCDPRIMERSRASGWLFSPDPYPADPPRSQDAFAGPNLLWHAEAVIAYFAQLGLDTSMHPPEWRQLNGYVNYRTTDLWDESTMSDPEAALRTYDNAYFRRGREASDGSPIRPDLVFGQGSVGDFAYDSDVITHELGHYVVWTHNGPSSGLYVDEGSTAEPGALNEGLADYFAAARMEDPIIGLYSGDSLGRPYIRTLEGDAACPASIYGQVHADSQPFSQGLWAFRQSIDEAQRPTLDRAVLTAIDAIGTSGGFPLAAEAMRAEVALALGDVAADALSDEWDQRSFPACDPIVDVEEGVAARSYTLVPAFWSDSYEGAIPGYIQFRIPAEGPVTLNVSLIQAKSNEVDLWGTNTPQPVVLRARDQGPITYTPYFRSEDGKLVWDNDGTDLGKLRYTQTLDTSLDGRKTYQQFSGSFELIGNGPYYVQLANTFPQSVTAYDLTFTWTHLDVPDADTGTPIEDTVDKGPTPGGCSAAQAGWMGTVAWFGFLGLVLRRRSRQDESA